MSITEDPYEIRFEPGDGMPDWWAKRWPNFSLGEVRCHHCGVAIVVPEYMDRVQALRDACRFPLAATSWYRCPAHNAAVSSTGLNGPHTTGRATDFAVLGLQAFVVVDHATTLGFTGIGVSQKGPHQKRFIHLDDLGTEGARRRPYVWSY